MKCEHYVITVGGWPLFFDIEDIDERAAEFPLEQKVHASASDAFATTPPPRAELAGPQVVWKTGVVFHTLFGRKTPTH